MNQKDANKVNGYIVVDFHNTTIVHYDCPRQYWGKEVKKMYLNLTKTNINCPMVPYEVMKWNHENQGKNPRIAYFAILDD